MDVAFALNRRMKLAGAVFALSLVLLGSAAGAPGERGEGRIVFASQQPSYPPPTNLNVSRIYSVGVDGRGRRNVGGTAGWGASLSPDGTKIAYWYDGLWVMNADGSSQRRVLSRGPQVGGEAPALFDDGIAWSPDGTKLAFSGAVVDLDGVVVGSTGHDPAWSPDGSGSSPSLTSRTMATLTTSLTGRSSCRAWMARRVVSSRRASASRRTAAGRTRPGRRTGRGSRPPCSIATTSSTRSGYGRTSSRSGQDLRG
jgi:WD40 repeat protein